jgi:putative acetyltransferase
MRPDAQPVIVRAYRETDATATLALFERAIRITAAARYTDEQREAWIGPPRDPREWNQSRLAAHTVVAEVGGAVAGFADLVDDRLTGDGLTDNGRTHDGLSDIGLVDMLFVEPDRGRRGVASALLEHIVALAGSRGMTSLTTHASLVARPVFERAGFVVVETEEVERGGQTLTRYAMRRAIPHSASAPATQVE